MSFYARLRERRTSGTKDPEDSNQGHLPTVSSIISTRFDGGHSANFCNRRSFVMLNGGVHNITGMSFISAVREVYFEIAR